MDNSSAEKVIERTGTSSAPHVKDVDLMGIDFDDDPGTMPSVSDLKKKFEGGDALGLNVETVIELEPAATSLLNNGDMNEANPPGKLLVNEIAGENKDEESEDEFYYISDDEEDKYLPSHKNVPALKETLYPELHSHRPTSPTCSAPSLTKSTYASVAGSSSGVRLPQLSQPPTIPPRNPNPRKELSELGRCIELDCDSAVWKLIELYASNSIKIDSGSKLTAKVHKIYKIEAENAKFKPTLFAKARNQFGLAFSSTKNFEMFLWVKTTPDSIRRLAQSKNSCIAFYDRLCRALPLPIGDFKEEWRQLILLCKVDLGKMHKSPQGYSRWSTEICPPGMDSVKGMGKFRPNWYQNRKIDDTIVPCGETEKETRFHKFELDFNEYLVYNSKQIQVQFAVDIEIHRK